MRRLAALTALTVLTLATTAHAASLLNNIGGRGADLIEVTASSEPGEAFDRYSEDLDRKRFGHLRHALSGQRAEPEGATTTIAWLHASNDKGERAIEVLRDTAGRVYTRADVNGRVITLAAQADELAYDLHRWMFRPRPPTALSPGVPMGLKLNELVPSPWTFDEKLLKERVFIGMGPLFRGQERDLGVETVHVRLPKGYDEANTPGLLIWASPKDDWVMPQTLFEACDSMNLVLAAAEGAGNGRNPADRFQLALDAVATAANQVRLDPDRVYITGMSGGGRISSMLWAAMPDVFAGAVPIVGINVYENVPSGDDPENSEKHWRKAYGLPKGDTLELLRTRPIAPVSGPEDFNYVETQRATAIMAGDGFIARFFDVEGLAHAMPTPERFTEALMWVESSRPDRPE